MREDIDLAKELENVKLILVALGFNEDWTGMELMCMNIIILHNITGKKINLKER